jgi:hypothetical protein
VHTIFITLLPPAIILLFGLLCAFGARGGLTMGIAAAEILASSWNHRSNSSPPPKIYLFNRRIHHGEIGTILALFSLLLKRTPFPSSALTLLLGMGIGLAKDDYRDIMTWFRLTKREDADRKQNQPGLPKHEEKRIWELVKRQWHDDDDNRT